MSKQRGTGEVGQRKPTNPRRTKKVERHSQRNRKLVTLDSSVYIAAARNMNSRGGAVLQLAVKKHYRIVRSTYIEEEVERNIQKKVDKGYKDIDRYHRLMARLSHKLIKMEPPPSTIRAYSALVRHKDAPIVALAAYSQSNFLVTSDLRDLVSNQALQQLLNKCEIISLGKFLKKIALT